MQGQNHIKLGKVIAVHAVNQQGAISIRLHSFSNSALDGS